MKGLDLIKGMGYIDDELAGEALDAKALGEGAAESSAREKRSGIGLKDLLAGWSAARRWTAAVACLALLCLAGLGAYRGLSPDMAKDAAQAPALSAPNESGKAAEGPEIVYMADAEEDSADSEAAGPTLVSAALNGQEEPAAEAAPLPELEEAPEEPAAMISGMYGGYDEFSYEAPENGRIVYSVPLTDAMAKFGDGAEYRVALEIFRDGEALAGDDPEIAGLLEALSRDRSVVTAVETVTAADGSGRVFNTIQATFEQLKNFPADEDHGWMLYLYDEVAQ